ncbi:Rpn family recombination-promoting nuclease/putative transposase [Arcicella rigui]|uniref:Rpn family recombination-promoting nuclease/putative transposase n=1 Tax=Arcicella rigui TaxID=797020 RepID=A0ABU5QCJ1_9BACT|nr:Rpn family recombination-promoting nuclease/putative transposase [Arcicella rigui]MEA5140566.1 Rpn family recombination-promoting nuclease/putative transposase [Arcicella rigui]
MAKYLNPYTDFGFKKLFGEEGNRDLLIDFLNQLLPPHHQIADLNFRNPENLADLSAERKAIFDIHCKALSGERFIVEMQKAKVKYFKDRSLFYVTFPIRDQAQQGDWNFKLEPIYFVAILDFEYDESEERRKFRRDVALKDQDGDMFFDKLHFKFLQMPLFNKKENELATKFDKWCYFLKNLESFDHIPNILNEPIFQKAFGTAELANLSAEQRAIYEENLIQYWGMKSALETAVEEREFEIAKIMLADNEPNERIVKYTGLTVEQIERLRAELKKQN